LLGVFVIVGKPREKSNEVLQEGLVQQDRAEQEEQDPGCPMDIWEGYEADELLAEENPDEGDQPEGQGRSAKDHQRRAVLGRQAQGYQLGLVPQFGQEDHQEGRPNYAGSQQRMTVLVGTGVQQGRDTEEKEQPAGYQLGPEQGKDGKQCLAEKNSSDVQYGKGQGNPNEYLLPGIARGKGHGGQLGLVAELCQKDDAEGGQKNFRVQECLLFSI